MTFFKRFRLFFRTCVGCTILLGLSVWAWQHHIHPWSVFVTIGLSVWLIARDLYLSRWRLVVTDSGIELTHPTARREFIQFVDICRVQDIHPGARKLFMLLRERPNRARTAELDGSRIYTIAIPVGFQRQYIWRRLWTLSGDLLLQAGSGNWMLIPIACLGGAELRELWIQLRLKVRSEISKNDFRMDSKLIKEALQEEEYGDKAVAERHWKIGNQYLENAASLWRKCGHIDSMTRCQHHQIECLMRLGRFNQAGGLAAQVINLARNLDNIQILAGALNHVAEASVATGSEPELLSAISNIHEAIKIHEGRQETFMICRMHCNLAIVYEKLFLLTGDDKQLKNCEKWASKALRMFESQLVNDSSYAVRMQRANVEGTLAHCKFHSKKYREAAEHFERAQPKGDRTEQGFFIEDLAMWGLSLFHAWAERSQQASSEIILKKQLHQALFKLDEAARLVALHGDFNDALLVFANRGDAYWGLNNFSAALRDYETVIGLLETRKYLMDRSFERVALLRKYHPFYKRVIEGYLRMAQKPTGVQEDALERAFQHCERSKARGWVEGMGLAEFMRQNLPDDLRDRLEKAWTEFKNLLWLKNQVVLNDAPNIAEQSQRLYRIRQKAIQDFDQIMEVIYKRYPQYAEMIRPKIPSLVEIQSHLPIDRRGGILEFSVGETALGVFLVLPDVPVEKTCFFIEELGAYSLKQRLLDKGWLGKYDKHVNARDRLRACESRRSAMIRKISKIGLSDQNFVKELSQLEDELSKLRVNVESTKLRWIVGLPEVLEDISQLIFETRGSNGHNIRELVNQHGVRRLVIVPDGLLHRLPLHAALNNLEAVTLSHSSAVLMSAVDRLEPRPTKGLVVAHPKHPGLVVDEAERRSLLKEADFLQGNLSHAGVEVVRLDEEKATAHAIMNHLSKSTFFHFCGHAESDFSFPLNSHLKVAVQTPSPIDVFDNKSQFLTAGELLAEGALKHGAWIILHACESGIAPPEPTGECLGLPAGFLLAGAGLVLSTLWEVSIETPGFFMARFYDGVLQNDFSPAEALRRAIGVLRERRGETSTSDAGSFDFTREDHPFNWAGFVIWGGAWLKEATPANALKLGSHELPLPTPPIGEGSGVPPQLQKVLRNANPLIEQKQFPEAIRVLEQALIDFGPCPLLWEALGGCYADMGDFDRALPHWQKLVDSDPNSFYHHYNLGCFYREFARITEAKECFKKALYLNPVYAKALFNLAGLTNDPDQALNYLLEAQAVTPEDPDLPGAFQMWEELRGKQQCSISQHRLFWALEDFKRGDFAHARFHLAMSRESNLNHKELAIVCQAESDILRKEGKLADSIRKLEEAIRYNPLVAAYWNTLGARRQLLEKDHAALKQAKTECLRAIELGDYAKPHQNLASIYLSLGQVDQAREELAKAETMAATQVKSDGSSDKHVCIGCPTEGKQFAECDLCVKKAATLKREADLLGGNYCIDSLE